MTTSGTFYDGPTVTLAAGTWLILAQCQVLASSTATRAFVAKIWDGTTSARASTTRSDGTAQATLKPIRLHAIVTPGGSTTYKMSVNSNVSGDTLQGTTPSDKNTHIDAIKLA
jgi:hypothetical protein